MHDDVNTELNFNPSELANLTNLAIGSRKIESFCKSSNLSRSFVSKVLNCKLPAIPRKRSLYKLASASNGRVTANQLLLACGYKEISKFDTTFPIVVLAKNLDTLILLKQLSKSHNNNFIRYALVLE